MAVAQLYHHLAPKNEVGIVAKPLIRLLKGHRRVRVFGGKSCGEGRCMLIRWVVV